VRILALLATLTLALLLIAACNNDESNGDQVTTPLAIPNDAADDDSELSPVETPEDSDPAQATPTDDEFDPRRLEPHPIWLIAESGEQRAHLGAYFWILDEGVAADVQSAGFTIHEEPLELRDGESIRIESRGPLFPEEITLEVYTQDGNILEDISTREGRMDAFSPQVEPVLTAEIPNGEWTVDLEPGEYFIRLGTVWPDPNYPLPPSGTPVVVDWKRTAELSFTVIRGR
jgi:hypothetical protein